jgi:hypothetical protein
MNKWKRRAREEKADRKRLQEDIRVLRRSAVVQHWQSKKILDQVNALCEREAVALNQAEALREQVSIHAKTNADLREHLVALQESDMLDRWRRIACSTGSGGVREAWDRVFLASVTQEVQPIVSMCKNSWDALRRAIEGDEPSEAERAVRTDLEARVAELQALLKKQDNAEIIMM